MKSNKKFNLLKLGQVSILITSLALPTIATATKAKANTFISTFKPTKPLSAPPKPQPYVRQVHKISLVSPKSNIKTSTLTSRQMIKK